MLFSAGSALALLALVAQPCSLALAQTFHSANYFPNAYILQLATPATAKRQLTPLNPTALLNGVLAGLQKTGVKFTTRHTYNDAAFTGLSILAAPGTQPDQLAKIAGVQRVWPVKKYNLPKPALASDAANAAFTGLGLTSSTLLANAISNNASMTLTKRQTASYSTDTFGPHLMTGVNATIKGGLRGAGIKIGVIDSGVDYTNPILGGCFGANCHISFGYDFVGDAYTGANTPMPDSDPLSQCNEHGTHVTGTIGALPNNYGFTGVAPEATLGHYRVFGCTGFVTDDVILSALMRGFQDGCNVLTMSLGGSGNWLDQTPNELYIDYLATQGVVTTVAAGNDGAEGNFFSSQPSSSAQGFSIGATNVVNLPAYNANVPNQSPIPVLSAAPLNVNSGVYPVYFTSQDSTITNDACNPLPAGTPNLASYVTVVQRGTCLFTTKMTNVVNAGGKVMLIYNSATGSSMPYLDVGTSGLTAVGSLRREDGLTLLGYSKANKRLSMNFPKGPAVPGVVDPRGGGLLADFTISGPTDNMFPAVSFTAPGGNILSTFPLPLGGVGVISGTSMATPFAAGSVAVIKSARKTENLTPLQIRGLLTSTAQFQVSTQGGSSYSTVIRQGSGLVQLDKAVAAQTLLSPDQLALNDTAFAHKTQTVTVTNKNTYAMKYQFAIQNAEGSLSYDDAATSDILLSLAPATVSAPSSASFSTKALSVAAGATATFTVTITPPSLSADLIARFPIFSGVVRVSGFGVGAGNGKNEVYSIPFFGLANAISGMPILDSTGNLTPVEGVSYPYLQSAGNTLSTEGQTYTLGNGPTLYYRLAMGTPVLSIDLVTAGVAFTSTIPTNNNAGYTGTLMSQRRSRLARRELVPHSVEPRFEKTKRTPFVNSPLYSSVPTVGNLITAKYTPRDYVLTAPIDESIVFSGEYLDQNGIVQTVPTGVSYRLLLRALKVTTDPTMEANYESYLTPAFSFSS